MVDRRISIPGLAPAKRSSANSGVALRIRRTAPDAVVAWGWYVDGVKRENVDLNHATRHAKMGEGFVWLGLHDPSDEDMADFGRQFDLHPLAIEDAVEGHARSKVEQFGETLFAVVSTVAYIDHDSLSESSEIVSTGQIMIFVGPGFVLTVRRGDHAPLGEMRQRLEANPELLSSGPISVLYGVMDKVTDDYNHVVVEFERDIDEIENEVFARNVSSAEVDRIYNIKRELIEFRRSVVPLGAPLQALSLRDMKQVPEDFRPYFRELADHHMAAREAIQSFDDVLETILAAGTARISMQQNQDMRQISAWVAILAIPTTIFALFGTNFLSGTGYEWEYGFPTMIGATLLCMAVLFFVFKRQRWL